MLFKMIKIIIEQLKLKIIWHIILHPGFGVGFVTPKYESTHFFFEVSAQIWIADGWRIAGEALYFFGDDILMFYRLKRNIHPRHRTNLSGPHATTINHARAGDCAEIGFDGVDAITNNIKTSHAHTFIKYSAVHARALGKRLRDVGRRCLPIGW